MITSLADYFQYRGNYRSDRNNRVFIRSLGETAGFSDLFMQLERQLLASEGIKNGNESYLRIKKLLNPVNADDITFYTERYDALKNGQSFSLRNLEPKQDFAGILTEALKSVCICFQNSKTGVSDSILRNFAIKILYWLDLFAAKALRDWTQDRSIKIVAENVAKEQEYLFYYFLSLIGCEVLLLQNKEERGIRQELLQLSSSFQNGSFGITELPDFVPVMAANDQTAEKKNPVRVVIPPRERFRRTPAKPIPNSPVNTTVPVRETVGDQTEKSFEELARLATSVVMIAVYDENGEVAGTGSGIMVGRDGYILTNFHVIARGMSYSVRIEEDDQIYSTTEVIKYHQDWDLALLRIDRSLQPLQIYRGEKELVRGQKVVAIGSPLGMFNSVSDGIISGFRRIDDQEMIQFTAPISAGSSGGAVLNMYGEVIGISTAGMDEGQNINLAVCYDNIRSFAGNFIR